jgi:hypothetical protein
VLLAGHITQDMLVLRVMVALGSRTCTWVCVYLDFELSGQVHSFQII